MLENPSLDVGAEITLGGGDDPLRWTPKKTPTTPKKTPTKRASSSMKKTYKAILSPKVTPVKIPAKEVPTTRSGRSPTKGTGEKKATPPSKRKAAPTDEGGKGEKDKSSGAGSGSGGGGRKGDDGDGRKGKGGGSKEPSSSEEEEVEEEEEEEEQVRKWQLSFQ